MSAVGHEDAGPPDAREQRTPAEYEGPRIEKVLSPVELDREVLYAGPTDGTPVLT
jgi:hypothetical protein